MEHRLPSLKKSVILRGNHPIFLLLPAFIPIFAVLLLLLCINSISKAQEFEPGPISVSPVNSSVIAILSAIESIPATVENTLTWRVDFVRVEFRLFNRGGRLILMKDVFVDGSTFRFQDGTVSHSSIGPSETADFICLTPIHADSIAKFEHTVYWMEYDSLPGEAF